MVMKKIAAGEFKARCLALMEDVRSTRQPIVITKRGKPVAELVPHKPSKRSPFGIWKGKMKIKGDIISPIDVEWEALK